MKRQYNLRVVYKGCDIWLAAPYIKACFRWPKTHPDKAGAFSFFIGFFFFLACAMVFVSSVGAASWEPFRCVVEALVEAYFNDVTMVKIRYIVSIGTQKEMNARICTVSVALCIVSLIGCTLKISS